MEIIDQKSDVDIGRRKDRVNQSKNCYTHNYDVDCHGSRVDILRKPIGLNRKLVAILCNQELRAMYLKQLVKLLLILSNNYKWF